jgi:hypothetical protein
MPTDMKKATIAVNPLREPNMTYQRRPTVFRVPVAAGRFSLTPHGGIFPNYINVVNEFIPILTTATCG